MNETNPILGRWRVKMLDWWIGKIKMPRCFWWWFRNEKYIWQNIAGSIQGHNVLWGWRKWGDFDVTDQGMNNPELFDHYTFTYKRFSDYVSLDGDKADGNLFVNDKRRATFAMTRIILPEPKEQSI